MSHQYRYDEDGYLGLLTSVVEAGRTIRFTYDWAGRLRTEVVSETGISVPFTTQYEYDADGALRQLTYPSGLAVQLERDPATRAVVAVRNAATGAAFASNVVRLPGGPISSLAYGNGRTLLRTFNARYEPVGIQSGPLWLTYTPSPAGDVSAVADGSEDPVGCLHDRSRTFRYDFQDRLSGWIDAVNEGTGTCPSEGLGASAAAFRYVPGTDRIASQLAPDATGKAIYAFGYDNQGSISAVGQYDEAGTGIARAVCLRHDALGRLVLVGETSSTVMPGGTVCATDGEVTAALARFQYDGQNRRVARQVSSQWTHTVFDVGGNPLSEFMRTSDPGLPWAKVRDYVWLDGRLLVQIEYTGGGSGPAYAYYAHVDHLGTPRMLTNEAGELVWSTFQRPYGEIGEKTKVDPRSGQVVVTNLRLPGQYDERLLGNLGLQGPYYSWHRWYLPGVGRYIELDPIGLLGSFNALHMTDWYNYALANPLRYSDPWGLQAAACPAGSSCQGCVWVGDTVACPGGPIPMPPIVPIIPIDPNDPIPVDPRKPPPIPNPPTDCTIEQQPPPPDVQPRDPSDCGVVFSSCVASCGRRFSSRTGVAACASTVCVAAWMACQFGG